MWGKAIANLVKGAVSSAAATHGQSELWDKIKSDDDSISPLNPDALTQEFTIPGHPSTNLANVPGLSGSMAGDIGATPGVISKGEGPNPIGVPAAGDPNPSNWMNSGMLAGGSNLRRKNPLKNGMQSTILTGGSGIYSNTP